MESGKNAGNHSPEGKKRMLKVDEWLWKVEKMQEIIAQKERKEC